MEKKKIERLTEEQIDYNVLNALNLMNEELGESYIATHFNPFDEGFTLNEEFVIERFNNACIKKELISPDFITNGKSETKQAFENSLNNLTQTLSIVDDILSEYTLEEKLKKQYNKLRLYIMCRIQLTNIFLAKLKTDKNTLKMYQELQSLDWQLAECFNNCYYEQFNTQIAISAFIELVLKSKPAKESVEDKKLIEKAKRIIAQNNMKQNVESPILKEEKAKEESKLEKQSLKNDKLNKKTSKTPTEKTTKEQSTKDEDKIL